MRMIFLGDVVGRAGREVVARELPLLKERYRPDLVILMDGYNDFIHHTPCTQNRTDLAHRTARGRGSTHPTGRTCTVNWEQSTCTCSLMLEHIGT